MKAAEVVSKDKKLNSSIQNFKDQIDNSAVKNQGFTFSHAVSDLANINDAKNQVLESIPGIGTAIKNKRVAKDTAKNVAMNMGTGAIKSVEGAADAASDLIFNPWEQKLTYGYDYLTKGKKTADENLKDLIKQQEEDIKKNRTAKFLKDIGYTDVADELEKKSLVKRDNLGGQVSQGIGGMVPSLVLGQAFGGTPDLKSTAGLTGKEKAAAVLGNMGKTYMSQLPANAMLSSSAYGGGMEEALNEGANMNQARLYGLSDAAIESLTEMMTGGIPGLQGKGGLDQLTDLAINKTGGYVNPALKTIRSALGEGLEEYTSTMLNPLAKKIYSDKEIDWKKQNEEALQSGLVGTITGAFLNGGQTMQDFQNVKNQNTYNKLNNQIEQQNQELTDKLKHDYKISDEDLNQLNKLAEQRNAIEPYVENTNKISEDNILNKTYDSADVVNEAIKNYTDKQNIENELIKDKNKYVEELRDLNNFKENLQPQRKYESIDEIQQKLMAQQNNQNVETNEPSVNSQEFKDAQQKLRDGTATERERKYIQTATEAQNTQHLIEDMDEVAKNYEPIANEKSMKQAEAQLANYKSVEEQAQYVRGLLSSGKRITPSDITAAQLVLKNAAATKNTQLYQDVLADTAMLGTEYGQVVQAMSQIQKLSPTGQLDMLERFINRERARGNRAYDNVEVTQEMRDRILECYDENGKVNQEQFDNTMEDIKNELANNIKSDIGEKARSWRYLSMLGNPKTHVRNVVANTAMFLVKDYKDFLNSVGQDIFIRDKANKTSTLAFSSKDVRNLANETWEQVKDMAEGNKYNEKNDLENRKRIFKFGLAEWARKTNENLLTKEDLFAKKLNYKKSFKRYLTAQGIKTAEDIKNNPQIVERAKEFALQEANVATFNQKNKLSEYLNSMDYKLGTPGKLLRGAIIPFTRTPLNIAKTGIEYTPGTGMLTTIADVKKAPKSMKGTVLIDGLSKQMAGGSLAILGYALAKSGHVKATSGEDKDDKFEQSMGADMDYSIKLGDTSYDLSWLSPSAMPFFVGARMFDVLDKQEGINENLILESLASTLDPLSEMSVVKSFTDILKSYQKSSTGMLKDMGVSTMQSYLSQYIPTLSGQFARWVDDTKRTTSADKNSPNKISQETLRQLQYKIPGLRNMLPESTDMYGNTNKEYNKGHLVKGSELFNLDTKDNGIVKGIDSFFNSFVSPMNKKEDKMTDEDKEILRVYNQVGDSDIIPSYLPQYLKYNNNYEMTREQYNDYKKVYGEAFTQNIKELMNTSDYKNASDDEKSEMIEGIMKYSKDKAKDTYLTLQGEDYRKTNKKGKKSYYESDKVDSLTDNNFSIADYYIYKANTPNIVYGDADTIRNRLNLINTFGIDKQVFSDYMTEIGNIEADKDANGKTISGSKKMKIFNYINSLDLTKEQKIMLMKKMYKSFNYYDNQLYGTINNSGLTSAEKQSLKNFLKIGE